MCGIAGTLDLHGAATFCPAWRASKTGRSERMRGSSWKLWSGGGDEVAAHDITDALLTIVDEASPYALTGAIFARDRKVVHHMASRLRGTAGNFYINDRPTGSVVGQQPFGGGRASGTNDKAGSMANMMRWTSPRSIKETFNAPTDHRYPHMG